MHILFLVPYKGPNGYLNKMSRVRFHGMEAVGKLVDLTYWGNDWEYWDNSLSVKENIEKVDGEKPDLIVTYKPLEMKGIKDVDIPVCLRYNESYDWEWTTKEIDESGAEFVVFHHSDDLHGPMSDYQKHYGDKVKCVHIPHCAEKEVFKDYGQEKDIDFLIAGATHAQTKLGNHYPLRDRMVGILQKLSTMGYNVYKHPHPGYVHNDAYTNKYLIDFAKVINRAKICITCSGVPKSRFGKYIEIPMCNTAIAADIPHKQEEDEFRKFVIEIDMSMSDDEIMEKLIWYIKNENDLKLATKKGLEWSSKYTQEYYAKRFIDEAHKFLKGRE